MPDDVAARIEAALAKISDDQERFQEKFLDGLQKNTLALAGLLPEIRIHRVLILMMLAGAVGVAYEALK